jgi:hypothetical protein
MYEMNSDFFDGFAAMFSEDEVIINEEHFLLGSFAVMALNLDRGILREIERQVPVLEEAMIVFLSARDAVSAAEAQEVLNELWDCLMHLPVYHLFVEPDMSHHHLLQYLREHPEETDDMVTSGTKRHHAYSQWIEKLERFTMAIETFIRNTDFFVEEYLESSIARTPDAYAAAFGRYQCDARMAFEIELEEKEETGSIEPVEHVEIEFPTKVSFVSVQNGNKIVLAEKMVFDELSSFLYTDLYRGMAAGHISRRCDNCGRYFLLSSGYDIRYCMSIAPGETSRTCRQVGAHRKEKEKIGSDFVRREYAKYYNRLKQRKNRGRLSVDEWNRLIGLAQNIRDAALRGEMDVEELGRRLGGI